MELPVCRPAVPCQLCCLPCELSQNSEVRSKPTRHSGLVLAYMISLRKSGRFSGNFEVLCRRLKKLGVEVGFPSGLVNTGIFGSKVEYRKFSGCSVHDLLKMISQVAWKRSAELGTKNSSWQESFNPKKWGQNTILNFKRKGENSQKTGEKLRESVSTR